MNDITELAQREKFEVWAHSQKLSLAYGDCGYAFSSTEMAWRAWMASSAELVEALDKSEKTSEARREAIDRAHNMFVRERDRANAAEEALEKAQQVDEELCRLLPPGAEYMDPPDGGDVTPLEGVRRMVADYRQRIAELREWNAGLAQESFERQQRISELLEGRVGNALLERENHHVEVVGELAERIAELESRTVKMPKLKMLEDYLAEVAIEERKQILVGVKLEFHRACAAAGIKVEAD
ncbi:TPA: hypothetical protein ACWL7N_001108 [Klebsiella quasipneumoniae]